CRKITTKPRRTRSGVNQPVALRVLVTSRYAGTPFVVNQLLIKLAAMKYRRLGKTGLRVSVVGIGTWQLGGEWGKDFEQGEVDAMFEECRRAGINFIDTAEC